MSEQAQPVFADHDNLRSDSFPLERAKEVVRQRLAAACAAGVRFLVIDGPARSGTTLLQIIAAHFPGVRFSEFQPVKAILRNGPEKTASFKYSGECFRAGDILVVKETRGPYFRRECTLDIVGILLEAGVDPQNIVAIYAMRTPAKAFGSWSKFIETEPWRYELALRSFMGDYERYCRVVAKVAPFFYEALENEAQAVLAKLFRQVGFEMNGVGLQFDTTVLCQRMRWNEADPERGNDGRYYWTNVVEPMLSRGGFYFHKNSVPPLPPAQALDLAESDRIYAAWCQHTRETLEL